MSRNTRCFLIGLVGAALTLSAYHQTAVSPRQCLLAGLFVLLFGLLVKEGFFF